MKQDLIEINVSHPETSKISQVDWDNLPFGKVFTDHMLVMDYKNGKWQSPEIMPFGPIPMHPAMSALHYGQSIFEGLKAYKNIDDEVVLFRPDMNAKRFAESAARMCMPEVPEEIFMQGMATLINIDEKWVPAQEDYEIQTYMDGGILTIYDNPWPGFTPDLLSVVLVTATQANGTVLIHQKMFESRLFFVDKLIDMGAQIILCDPHRATVIGLNRKHLLKGIHMTSPDIRAGVALLIAALSAEGKSMIHNIEQIDRGYERIDERLNALGASIKRV